MEKTVKRVVEEALQDTAMLQVLANLIKETLISSVVAELKKTIECNNAVISELKAAVNSRDVKIQTLENKLDDLEQYQRRQCLRIFGVKEEENEDTDKQAIEVAHKIGVDLQLCDIDRSHRIGRRENSDRPRPIIVKFTSYRKRSEVFRSKRRLRSTGVVIHEDLTKARYHLLREAITKYGLNNVWTQDGVVIVARGETKLRLTCWADLEK